MLLLPDSAKNMPHSRACGIAIHDHGTACHKNCPTCEGEPVVYQTTYDIPRDENGMKYDWVEPQDIAEAEALEEHIAKLMEEQIKEGHDGD